MGRYGRIIKHPVFLEYIKDIKEFEKDRIYCGHDLSHLIDVARIAYITVLEKKLTYDKDIIYAAGLLHDIGRTVEYRAGIPHDIAVAEPAAQILKDCGYDAEEIMLIITAISEHRGSRKCVVASVVDKMQKAEYSTENSHCDPTEELLTLSEIIYTADKQSRNCFVCAAADTCNWPEYKRNNTII